METKKIREMIGRVPLSIRQSEDEIEFAFADGSKMLFFHLQECCESVTVEDVNGNWQDLIGNPILVAEARYKAEGDDRPRLEYTTWTFYTFRGVGGSVDVRWFGTSNGCYSEEVDERFTPPSGAIFTHN